MNKKVLMSIFILAILFLVLGIWTTMLVKKYEEKQTLQKINNKTKITNEAITNNALSKGNQEQEIVHEPPEGEVSAN
ncbi:MAG: hypothetical protein AB1472_02440 [Candidatus Omnitrophota bacterium]